METHNSYPSTQAPEEINQPTNPAGYLELDEFLGNHHPSWFDVTYQNDLGHKPPKFDHSPCAAFNCMIPNTLPATLLNSKRDCSNIGSLPDSLPLRNQFLPILTTLSPQNKPKKPMPQTPCAPNACWEPRRNAESFALEKYHILPRWQ
jgi:hypothetical protein